VRLTVEGWLDLGTPAPSSVRWARGRRAQHDAEAGYNDAVGVPAEQRAAGDLGELAVARWLEHEAIPFTWYGGVDDRPDFTTTSGLGIDAKTQGFNVHPRETFDFSVYDQRGSLTDELVCVAHVRSRFLILGGIPRERFEQRCRRTAAGDRLASGGIARQSSREIPIAELERPVMWIESIRARAGFPANAAK
jgi:hypothetical protein